MRGRPRSSGRGLVEDCLVSDVAYLPRPRPKLADTGFVYLTVVLTTKLPDLKDTTQTVTLEVTRPHFGGVRYWYLCPACKTRRRKLFTYHDFLETSLRPYLCRVCLNLSYSVQYRKSASAIAARALCAYLKTMREFSSRRRVRNLRRQCKLMRQFSTSFGVPGLLKNAENLERILDWEAEALKEDRST
jgi:hypothetical protein